MTVSNADCALTTSLVAHSCSALYFDSYLDRLPHPSTTPSWLRGSFWALSSTAASFYSFCSETQVFMSRLRTR